LENDIAADAKKKATYASEAEALSEVLQQQVRNYVKERTQLQQNISALKATKKEVLRSIEASRLDFIAKKESVQTANSMAVHQLRQQVSVMDSDRKEAATWSRERQATLNKLEALTEQIKDTTLKSKQQLDVMRAEHEEEKRGMRDMLIRRLRRVRDIVSSTTEDDDDGAGDGASSVGGESVMLTSTGPTAKQNERMARAVSLYEREAKTVVSSIHQLSAELEASRELLEEQKQQNERLVMKNASSVKTRSVLLDQVTDVKHRYHQAENRLLDDVKLRKSTVAETATSQSEILFHLQLELEHAIAEYERTHTKVRLLRKEGQQHGGVANEANKFFTETSMLLLHGRSAEAGATSMPPQNRQTQQGQSGAHFAPVTVARSQPPPPAGRETIPALLLSDPQEIASFFSAALCSS
jgi:hypothetical protein